MPVESFLYAGGKFLECRWKVPYAPLESWKVSCMLVESLLCVSRKFLTENSHHAQAPNAASEHPVRSRLLAQVKAEYRTLSIGRGPDAQHRTGSDAVRASGAPAVL